MQYGSIGWSVGATLGYAQSVPNKRVIACIGDGSFQVSMHLTYKAGSDRQLIFLHGLLLSLNNDFIYTFRESCEYNAIGQLCGSIEYFITKLSI